jgi:hypothetical protein
MINNYTTYWRSVPLVGSGTFASSLLTLIIVFSFSIAEAQWLDWANETSTRLTLTTVANSDDEEKDMWAADLNNDGDEDLIVVRKNHSPLLLTRQDKPAVDECKWNTY